MIFPSATLTSNAIDTAAGGLVACAHPVDAAVPRLLTPAVDRALSSFGTTFDLYGTNFGAPGGRLSPFEDMAQADFV